MWRIIPVGVILNNLDIAELQLLGDRTEQQDSCGFFALDDYTVAVLADGMGGHAGGREASQLVAKTIKKSLDSINNADLSNAAQALLNATNQANQTIKKTINQTPELKGMGTTLICVMADTKGFLHLSVGDSPLFLYRDKQLKRINENHAYAEKLKKQLFDKTITQEDFDNHPQKHAITSVLMGVDIPLIDNPQDFILWQAGDYLILASDGLETLNNKEITKICQNSNTAKLCTQNLIDAVDKKNQAKQDNCSVVVISPGQNNHKKRFNLLRFLKFFVGSAVISSFAILIYKLWLN